MKYKLFFYLVLIGAFLPGLLQADALDCVTSTGTIEQNTIVFTFGAVSNSASPGFQTSVVGGVVLGDAGYAFDSNQNPSYQTEAGFWTQLKKEALAPYVLASDGAYADKVVVQWNIDPLSPAVDENWNVYRDGILLATVNDNATEYQDFNILGGQFYEYAIIGNNQFGEGGAGCDMGFVNPNGVITGRVQTQNGRAVPDVDVSLTPLVGAALDFDGADDYVDLGTLNPVGNFSSGFTFEAWAK